MVCMYVNKKNLILIFLHKALFHGFEKEKKQLKGLFLHVQFSVRAECFACASACTSYHKHLIGKPGYTGFHDDIWNSLLLFQIFRCNAPCFFTKQNKDAQKIGHTSEVLNS